MMLRGGSRIASSSVKLDLCRAVKSRVDQPHRQRAETWWVKDFGVGID